MGGGEGSVVGWNEDPVGSKAGLAVGSEEGEEVGLKVLGRNYSHLFVRCFHGTNTWDEPHFLRKLYRRPSDWPQYMVNKLCRRDIFHHRSFQLNQAEQGTVEDMLNYHMGEAANDLRKKVVA